VLGAAEIQASEDHIKGAGRMTSRNENVTEPSGEDAFSRRKFLTVASAGVAGTVVTGRAVADTLADVPPREVGADLSGHGERSKFVHLAMLPEAGPGKRNVDPSDAITPTDLHYERSHSGNPDLDPAKHRLLVHGMTRRRRRRPAGPRT
jgi:sulfane dehydrogenase subunit SoxC